MFFHSALVAPAIPAFGRVVTSGRVQGFGVDAPISVAERLGRHAARALIPDASTEAEMRALLEEAERSGTDLMIGARGLAEALAERMSDGEEASAAEMSGGPALFVIGSRDPITLARSTRFAVSLLFPTCRRRMGGLSGQATLAARSPSFRRCRAKGR